MCYIRARAHCAAERVTDDGVLCRAWPAAAAAAALYSSSREIILMM